MISIIQYLKMSAWLVLVFLQFISVSRGCLRASNGDRDLPNFVRPGGGDEPRFEHQPIQAIITSYQFVCCGVITEWRAYVERSGGMHQDGVYSISFQVWRPNSPSPVNTDGCYTLIGVNHFPNIQLPDVSSMRGLVNETPSVDERIEVQPGDVIGFYLTSSWSDDDGIQFAGASDNNNNAYDDETVWFVTETVSINTLTTQYSVGTSGTLSISTNLAPLITASVSTFISPISTSMVAMYSTPTPTPSPSPTTTSLTTEPTTTEPIVDESFPPTDTSKTTDNPITTDISTTLQEHELVDIGLIAGVTVPVIIVIIPIASVIVVILTCVVMKRRSKLAQESSEMVYYSQVNPVSDQTDEGPYYSSMETQPSITKNEAYGKFTQATSTDDDPDYYVNDPSNDLTIPTSQNAAYGDITTSTNDDEDYYVNEGMNETATTHKPGGQFSTSTTTIEEEDYYVNEGMNEPMTTNETYGKVSTANVERNREHSENKAYGDTTRQDPANDSSIPTTKNEAYTRSM